MTQKTKSTRAITFAILLVGAAVILGLWFFKPQPAKRPFEPPLPVVVDVMNAQPMAYRAKVSTQGTIAPSRQIKVMAEVSGRVIEVNDQFTRGGFFKSSDTLVKLDDRDYRFALANTEAQLANAERELALEKGQARQAKRIWRDLGSSEANELSLRAPQVKAATASLKAARAEKQRAELNIKRTSIKVPFDGRVNSTSVELGEFVSAGTVLGEVFDNDLVEVRLPLNIEQFSILGLTPSADSDSFSNIEVVLSATMGNQLYEWQAKLKRIESVIDSRTRLFHIIAEVAKPFDSSVHEQPLIVGLFVKASLRGKLIENVIAVPKKAVNNKTVFVVEADNTLALRNVEEVDHGEDIVWLKSAIREGEKIVVSDPRVLDLGTSVTIKNTINNTESVNLSSSNLPSKPAATKN